MRREVKVKALMIVKMRSLILWWKLTNT